MNEQQSLTILNSWSFVGFFSDYGCWNTEESVSFTDSDVQTFLGKKTKIKKVEPGATYSVALVMAFLAAENESQRLIDLPQADFGCVPERFLFLFIFFCR